MQDIDSVTKEQKPTQKYQSMPEDVELAQTRSNRNRRSRVESHRYLENKDEYKEEEPTPPTAQAQVAKEGWKCTKSFTAWFTALLVTFAGLVGFIVYQQLFNQDLLLQDDHVDYYNFLLTYSQNH